ncbi:FAD binding domain-containing protein, partial [bacterium]|nr:FAD binding domain-containing protein [candidate division CSSED10-310 bacterium]
AAGRAASTPLRNLITIGGSLVGLLPWSDPPVALLCMDADVLVEGLDKRRIPIAEFILGPPARLLASHEIVTSIEVRDTARIGTFIKFSRTDFDFSLADVAMSAMVDDGILRDVRIALGAVEGLPRLLETVGLLIEGRALQDVTDAEIRSAVAAEVRPRHDKRVSRGYLLELTGALVIRVLNEMRSQMEGDAR